MTPGSVWDDVGGIAQGNDIIVETRSHRPFAVEIEAFLDPDEAVVRGVHPEAWDKGTDGSVRVDPGCRDASEFRSPPFRGDEGLRLLHAGVKRLRELGYRANVSCGLHVHVNMIDTSNEDREALKKFGLWVERDIYKFVAPSRAEVRFCKPINDASAGRYRWLNLEAWARHRTVEFRLHHGVTRPETVVEWVKVCLRIVERGVKLGHRAQKPSGGIFDLLGMTAFEREYWTATAKRLHGENVAWEVI